MARHQLSATQETVRRGEFDATFPPVLTVASGDTVVIECVSGRADMLPPAASGLTVPPALERILAANIRGGAGHLLTGPVAVAGAEPGDMLEIRIDAIELGADWGYNTIRPLAGTLPGEFAETTLTHIPVNR